MKNTEFVQFGRRVSWVAAGFMAAVLVPYAHAQTGKYEGRIITDIQFSPRQPLHPADLAKAMSLKRGDTLRASAVAASIDALFATGYFEDIVVEAQPAGNGVVLRYVTQLTWFVGHTGIEGKIASPPNEAQIASAVPLSIGAPFHDQDVTAAVESIQKLLESNGLYNAEVTPQVQREDSVQQVYLTFTLRPLKRAKYEMPVIQGTTLLSDSTIVHATGWRKPLVHWWRRVTEARTNGGVLGILKKYQKQDRLTATADIEKLDYDSARNRVRATLDITAGPRVKVSSVEDKVSKRVLRRYVPVFEEGAVYNDLLVEGKRNLQDYLQNQGYYDAEVDFRIATPERDLQKLEYVISKGLRHKLVRLAITGNKYFATADIKDRMFLHAAAFNLRHGRYSEAFRRKDEQNITNLYRANGFRNVKVSTVVDRNYGGKPGEVSVTVHIDEGPQWIVDHMEVSGIQQAALLREVPQLSSSEGQPFSEANIAEDRNQVLNFYSENGFPAATFKSAWQPSGVPNHVNLVYTISEGDRKYVRDVTITGLRTTRLSMVEKTIHIQAGDPLSPVAQLNAQKRLYDLGVFARVDTAIQNPDGDNEHKYLIYSFDEADRYRLTLGFGAQVANFGTPSTTSLSAPGGTIGFSPQGSLEVSRQNLWGLGHTVTLKGIYSSIEKRASLSYNQPRFFGIRRLDATYSLLYDNTLDVRTFASRREEVSVQFSRHFSKTFSGILGFAYRRVSVNSVVIPVLLIPQFLAPVRIGMLTANLSQDRRDSPANPTRGMFNTVDLGLSSSFFGSERSFGRILLRNATYHKLTGHWILARQTRFGIIQPFSVPADITADQSVPLAERFFGGGADSMRGFAYNQAGPRDTGAALAPGGPSSQPTGFPLGGNALFFNNVELRFPLIGENIQGVLFYDLGNIFTSVSDISFRFRQKNTQDFNYMVHAAGFGLRYRTPVGPLRVDLAYSINPPTFYGFSGTSEQLLQCNPSLPPSELPPNCQVTKQRLGHIQFFFSIGQTF